MMNRLRRNGSVLTGLITLLLLLGSFSVQAQTTNTWTGTTDTDWNTTTNWSLTLVPTATHNVVIPASLTNYPILSSAASASTVEVESGASLTITSAGSLSVNGSKSGTNGNVRFRNGGTVTNAGQVFLGNSPSATAAHIGLRNVGTFTQNTGALMTIDRADPYGLLNTTASGSFVNSGTLAIGAVSSVGQYPLANSDGATFSNTTGGYITIDRATNRALWNSSASSSFVNSATIVIGSIAEVFQGIWNFGSFRNLADGFIAIDRTTSVGLSNSSTTVTGFTNSGIITIGSSATIGSNGLSNGGSFSNTAGGSITIDRTRFAGLYNGVVSTGISASFVNSATITFGTSLTSSIENDGMFNNQGGGCINPAPGLINSLGNGIITNTSSFSNTGTIIERSTGNSGISFNGGVIQNLNGGSFTVASGSLTPTASLTVTSNADSGPNTLRQAMLDVMATTCPGPFTITVTASGTINLASALPAITKSIVFLGPGAANLSIRRNTGGDYRLFDISANQTVSFDGFTLADGNATGSSPASKGGAIYMNSGSSLTVTNCVFNANRASADGGAIYSEASQLVLSNCRFTGNTAVGFGGVLESYTPNPVITNCFFTNNTASVGGAVDFYNSSPNITNCAFVGNSAGSGNGGAITTSGGSATVTNSSFRQNTGGTGPGQAQAIYNESSSFSLNNSVLFGNGVGQPITNTGSSTVVAAYSLFEPSVTGYTDGGNNRTTTLSPFASATGVALNACAPAIDAGNPASTTAANAPYSATNLPALDLTGNARIVAGLVDMGAVEYAGPGSFTTTLTAGPSSTITCAQTSLTLTATGGTSYTFAGPGLSQNGSMATAAVSQSGVYSVTATDATGCTTSASTTVYSNTLTPTAGLVASGTITCSVPAVTLTASGATGIPGGTYTFGGPSIVSTAGNLATVNVGGTYSVTVLNPANGCFATNTVSVSSDLGGAPPAPTLSASSSVVCAGATVMVVAAGAVAPMQWYLNGQPIGQTSATLTLGGVQAAQAGSYVLVVSGACSVTSAPFSLTVNPLPTVTILVPQGSMVNGPGTGTATITLPAPLTGVAMQASGGMSYERLIIIDRINGFEIRQVDTNANGIFNVNRPGPFRLTVTGQNGCKRTVEGVIQTP